MALALLLLLLLAAGAHSSLLTPEKREYCAVLAGSLALCVAGELGELSSLGAAACCDGAAELRETGCFRCAEKLVLVRTVCSVDIFSCKSFI
jgi:hypothetical protein